jgi:hypothetical protein
MGKHRFAALLGLVALAAPAAAQEGEPATRAAMGRLVETLAFVLPLSLDDQRFADPKVREEVLSALRMLALQAELLESHGGQKDASFAFLSRSLAEDSRDVLIRYQDGKTAEASFLLHRITDSCVACHSRLPDPDAHPVGRRLADAPGVASLPPEQRVQIEAATRQFDRALDTYEALFAAPDVSPADLDLLGYPDAYLEICLRVRRDPARPLATFQRLAARADVPPALADTLAVWIASLRELEQRDPVGPPLAEARALLDRAQDRSRFPDDRRALVYYVAASGVLHRELARAEMPRVQLAETYYLLGLIESRIGRTFWLSQTETFLEAAIRTAPEAPFAEDAYDLLEEFVASGYTGSRGGAVPPRVKKRLAELRALIDGSRAT